jgi:HTH-type transcriptional regulator, transcriptional repressor of NAD biosynthesis genes
LSPPRGLTIALLGAESSGKSTLAQALLTEIQSAWAADSAPTPTIEGVPETLRHWCEAHGRTPVAHEQTDLLHAQARQLTLARTRVGPSGWLVADTTPFMTAVYSEHYFADNGLYATAVQAMPTPDVTLLMGLDLPWQADGPWRDGPAVQTAVDTLLRQRLQSHGLRHHTIYGHGNARTAAALLVVALALGTENTLAEIIKERAEKLMIASDRGQFHSKTLAHSFACEACSDPDCEHLLFTRLLQARRTRD